MELEKGTQQRERSDGIKGKNAHHMGLRGGFLRKGGRDLRGFALKNVPVRGGRGFLMRESRFIELSQKGGKRDLLLQGKERHGFKS